jgi:ATP-dependent DNA helicase RecQ
MLFEPKKILKEYWGFDSFRSSQLEIVTSVIDGNDTLALLPTGGGKSICFQVPALCREGICIVVTPLIALMKDQVENLKSRGIKALAIHSGLSKRQIDIALDNAAYGNFKFMYVSPERLKTPLFQERLKKMNVNLIAIDEAHCISQWGYDFRPSYVEIIEFRKLLPNIPVLALTATATPKVVQDIQQKLGFPKELVIKKSFYRENLRYFVYNDERKIDLMLSIIKKQKGSGIIYVRSRNKTVEFANILKNNGITSDFYHAGLEMDVREKKQHLWMKGDFKVICTTNAFGMGIDKPDVRFVINVDLPESLEAYFQEAGRGGRDGNKSFAVLLINEADKDNLIKRTEQRFPPIDVIKRVYGLICNEFRLAIGSGELETFRIDWDNLRSKSDFTLNEIVNSAKFIERAGYWQLTENGRIKSTVFILMNQRDLYDVQVRYPKYDVVIKFLLRNYGGMFDAPVKILEHEVAKKLKMSYKDVLKILNELHKLEVIEYERAEGEVAITFLQPRIDMKLLTIPKEFYTKLKETAVANTNSMIHYAFSEHLCRSRMLLKYFGEISKEDCGVCDYCIEKEQNKPVDSPLLKQMVSDLKNQIETIENTTISEHVNKLSSQYKRDKLKFAIQWMLDNGIILVDDASKLKLN